jgi:antitoxin component of MazEF toxin-antitoxin module
METICRPKKWGNSLGITIPKEIVEKERITVKDELVIDIRKAQDKNAVKNLFGTLRFRQSAQELKDEMRKGWD